MRQEIVIENLKCGGCANTIKKGISNIDGISNVSVDLEKNTVFFESEESKRIDVANKLLSLGYPESGTSSGLESRLANAKSYISCAIGKISS